MKRGIDCDTHQSVMGPDDLKYMLESVQCEAKNLKLLLNLKDEQMQIYESKAVELAQENDDFNN